MRLQQYKTLILITTVALSLLIASPSIQQALVYPKTDTLTEFYLLGRNHDATYPSNSTQTQNNKLYLEITNHEGSAQVYQIDIKFRNQTQSAPNSFNHTNSDLPPLTTLTVAVAENSTEEIPLNISFQYVPSGYLQLEMQNITVNGYGLEVNSTTIAWDKQKLGFYGNLFFELSLYNSTTSSYQYYERYLSLWLQIVP
jgi:uncharacterized membrane protein